MQVQCLQTFLLYILNKNVKHTPKVGIGIINCFYVLAHCGNHLIKQQYLGMR